MSNTLTANQQAVLATLRERGADITAAATERAWSKGETYYLDSRNSARRGLVRAFERANKEAEAATADSRRAEFASRIAALGWTVAETAQRLGLSKSSIEKRLSGAVAVRPGELAALAHWAEE